MSVGPLTSRLSFLATAGRGAQLPNNDELCQLRGQIVRRRERTACRASRTHDINLVNTNDDTEARTDHHWRRRVVNRRRRGCIDGRWRYIIAVGIGLDDKHADPTVPFPMSPLAAIPFLRVRQG